MTTELNINKEGYLRGQSGVIVTCPICLGDMCGCHDDLKVKRFRICKGCSLEFQMKWGRMPRSQEVSKAIKKLVASGLWNTRKRAVPM
jgi:hypothetical protein